MKQTLFISIFTAISTISFGQWNITDTTVYYNNGYVGIGTSDPKDILHLYNSTGKHARLKVQSDENGGQSEIRLWSAEDNSFLDLSSGGSDINGNNCIFLNFQRNQLFLLGTDHTNNDNFTIGNHGSNEFLGVFENSFVSIKTSGEVGINEVNPTEKLVVNGNVLIKENNALILTSPNGTEFKITVDDNGNLTTSQTTSTQSIEIDYDVDIYPNPTQNKLAISINEPGIQEVDAEICNLAGKMIYMKNFPSNSFQINTADLAIGTYILTLKSIDGQLIKTEKFIKY